MKSLISVVGLTLLLLFSINAQAIELTSDNPDTLINTKSIDYTVFGLKLGMTKREAKKLIKKNDLIVSEQDKYNENTLYVYRADEDGDPTEDTLLSLAWDEDESKMRSITVFEKAKPYLSEKFQFLLSSGAIDEKSETRSSFLGSEDNVEMTMEFKPLGWQDFSHRYNNIGLSVIDKQVKQVTKSVIFNFYTKWN